MTNQNQSEKNNATSAMDIAYGTIARGQEREEKLQRDYDKLKEENEKLQKRVDVFERAKLIWERRNGDRTDLMDASQEAQHYNWLDEQNEKLEEENQRLKEELDRTSDALIHQGHTLRAATEEVQRLREKYDFQRLVTGNRRLEEENIELRQDLYLCKAEVRSLNKLLQVIELKSRVELFEIILGLGDLHYPWSKARYEFERELLNSSETPSSSNTPEIPDSSK